MCRGCVSVSSAQPHLQPFQLLLEVVLIHKLDFAELLLIFQVLLPHQLYLPKDLSRPVAGSPSGWSGGGERWGCHTEIMGRQARLKGKRGIRAAAGASRAGQQGSRRKPGGSRCHPAEWGCLAGEVVPALGSRATCRETHTQCAQCSDRPRRVADVREAILSFPLQPQACRGLSSDEAKCQSLAFISLVISQGYQACFLHINALCQADLGVLWASGILHAGGLRLQVLWEATLGMPHRGGDLGPPGRVPRKQCQSLPGPRNLEAPPVCTTGWARGLRA